MDTFRDYKLKNERNIENINKKIDNDLKSLQEKLMDKMASVSVNTGTKAASTAEERTPRNKDTLVIGGDKHNRSESVVELSNNAILEKTNYGNFDKITKPRDLFKSVENPLMR